MSFEEMSAMGLPVIYSRLEHKKKKIAIDSCKALLSKVDNWELLYDNSKRCVQRSFSYGFDIVETDLSEREKTVFFWKTIADELETNNEAFLNLFPEGYHKYNDSTFAKLYQYVKGESSETLFSKRYICFDDIKDFDAASTFKRNLRGLFNAICQDGNIEYSLENLETIKKWIRHQHYMLYIDRNNTWVEDAWIKFRRRVSPLEEKLFYWTALFWGECSGCKNSHIPSCYLSYNYKNLKKLFIKVQTRMMPKKRIIDSEADGYYHEWY